MLDDLYENNGYDVLKRTAEDGIAWRENKKKVPKTCCIHQTTEERRGVKPGFHSNAIACVACVA